MIGYTQVNEQPEIVPRPITSTGVGYALVTLVHSTPLLKRMKIPRFIKITYNVKKFRQKLTLAIIYSVNVL